jgi:hypothetical protein
MSFLAFEDIFAVNEKSKPANFHGGTSTRPSAFGLTMRHPHLLSIGFQLSAHNCPAAFDHQS